jgi:hypothetical protein
MQQEMKTAHAVKWGIIIGLVYCVFLWLRYSMGVSNPIFMGLWAFVGYVSVLILLLVSGFQLRKLNGGFIEFKEIFKYLFISVLIFEAFYTAFNFIYLTYVDPEFFPKFRDATEDFLIRQKAPQKDIDDAMERLNEEGAANQNVMSVVKTFLFSISVSGLMALIFSFIIRTKDPFAELNEIQ